LDSRGSWVLGGAAAEEEVAGDAFLVAVDDVRAAGQVGVGVGDLARAVALEAPDDDSDEDGGDEKFHGTKFT
jgi:small ligand-binding sensory domain FIST